MRRQPPRHAARGALARVWRSARGERFAQEKGRLPFGVLTDALGNLCARHARALDADVVTAMKQRRSNVD
jgi:hypothetical protein